MSESAPEDPAAPQSEDPERSEIVVQTLEEIREELRPMIAEVVLESRLFIGPIPPASELQAYDAISPGLADRVVRMAESEQGHRHRTQALVLQTESKLKLRGQPYAISALALIGALVVVFLFFHAPSQAAWVAVALIALVVAMFLGPEITKLVANRSVTSRSSDPEDADDDVERT